MSDGAMFSPIALESAFTAVRRTRHGFLAYNKLDTTIGASLTEYGEWSEAELAGCLLQIIKPGPAMLDRTKGVV